MASQLTRGFLLPPRFVPASTLGSILTLTLDFQSNCFLPQHLQRSKSSQDQKDQALGPQSSSAPSPALAPKSHLLPSAACSQTVASLVLFPSLPAPVRTVPHSRGAHPGWTQPWALPLFALTGRVQGWASDLVTHCLQTSSFLLEPGYIHRTAGQSGSS